MKILAIADRNPHLNFVKFIAENPVDLIMTLGDLTREDLIGLEYINIPKIGVYGNHDSGNYMNEFQIANLHMATWDFAGLKFGGFQGCVRYKQNPDAIMYTQDEASQMFSQFPPVDIFITHCPPRGINDEDEIAHQGFDGLRSYIDRFPPRILLHGHTYPDDENVVRQHGPTRIEYVYKYKVIEI